MPVTGSVVGFPWLIALGGGLLTAGLLLRRKPGA
ncbi:MAG: LPXTG cell wall anchor domain-containing protein [Chloroflexales bacterium]|nr:LPXTG cell wall anchor domain-containing protein [Chloroflexales bacterium]